jgi:hypothetical protein
VLTVLLEKEVEFTLVTVNSYAGECKKPEHLALHVCTTLQLPPLLHEKSHLICDDVESSN